MAEVRARDHFGAPVLSTLVAVLAHVPRWLHPVLSRTIGLGSDFLGLRRARSTDVNLALAFPALPARARRALARRSLVADARLALKLPATWHADTDRLLRDVEGEDAAQRLAVAERKGRGVLLLVPHLGNWELLCLWLQARADSGRPFTALYRPLADPGADRWLRARRERSGARLVPIGASGLRSLLRALRDGGIVAVLPDQVPPPGAGVAAPFYGRDARTMTLVRALVQRCEPEVLTAMALCGTDGYRVCVQDAGDGLGVEAPRAAAAALNRAIERCIAEAPEQYQWGYKRWRHAAPDGLDYYRVPR